MQCRIIEDTRHRLFEVSRRLTNIIVLEDVRLFIREQHVWSFAFVRWCNASLSLSDAPINLDVFVQVLLQEQFAKKVKNHNLK